METKYKLTGNDTFILKGKDFTYLENPEIKNKIINITQEDKGNISEYKIQLDEGSILNVGIIKNSEDDYMLCYLMDNFDNYYLIRDLYGEKFSIELEK